MDNFQRDGVMHIDTSVKLHKQKDTGIAYKIIESNKHKGLAIQRKLKKELKRDLNVQEDYARLYAISIFLLIKDDLELFDTLVICGDECIVYVKEYLALLFDENSDFFNKKVMSISELRKITGNEKLRSYADGLAKSYRKRALRCLARQQEGIELNPVRIDYKLIVSLWKKIDAKIKKVSGE